MKKYIDNDSIALLGLIIIAVAGLFFSVDGVTSASVGAIGGFIGSKNIKSTNGKYNDNEKGNNINQL